MTELNRRIQIIAITDDIFTVVLYRGVTGVNHS
jgi:hypothetical protein